jgi:RHS repeat-associated protein
VTTVTRSGNATIAGSVAGLPNSLTIKDNANLAIAATLYGDNSFARTNVSLLDGSNTFTAIAHDLHGRGDTNVVTVYNPVTVAYQYDVRGNMTNNGRQILTYDDGNQLISLLQSNACKSELSYDGLMRLRIRRDFGWLTTLNGWQCTNEVRYVYDGRLVVQERDAHDIAIVTYTRGNDLSGALAGAGGIGGLLARTDMRLLAIGSSGAHSYYYADGEGNVTMLIDQNQVPVAKYRYDPFGNVISAIGPIANVNLYRFSSKEYNPDYDIYYFGFRFYIPSLQRWLNRDPSEESGGFNLYGFVENDPNGFIDFYGLGGCHVWDIYNDPKANQQMDRRQAAENQKDTDLLKALAKQAAEMAKQSLNPESMIAGAFPAGGMGGAAKSLGGAAKAVSAADTAAAMAARDRVLAKIAENVANKTLSQNRANNISTVVGAVDTSTGKAVAAAKTSGIHGNQCAEDLAAKALGGDNPNIRYTPAIRPRNDKVIPPCDNCAAKYSGRFLTP